MASAKSPESAMGSQMPGKQVGANPHHMEVAEGCPFRGTAKKPRGTVDGALLSLACTVQSGGGSLTEEMQGSCS